MNERVKETLAGYERASRFLEKERMERLSLMTTHEARAIFADLVDSASAMHLNETDAEKMLRWRLQTIVAVRIAFKQLAQVKGWI